MSEQRVIVGPAIVAYINGQMAGVVRECRYQVDTPHEERFGVDSLMPYELVPTRTRVSGTVQMWRTYRSGGLQGMGVIPKLENLSLEKYFTLGLLDRKHGVWVFRADQCAVDGEDGGYSARALASQSFRFKGMSWTNEAPG